MTCIRSIRLAKKIKLTKQQLKKIGLNTLNAYAENKHISDPKKYIKL